MGKTSIKDNCFEQGHKIINKALSGLKNPKPVKLLQLKVIMLMKLNYDERAVDEV